MTVEQAGGREAQRRRTRRAIVDAAARLLADGRDPSIAEIAEEADVSRRTIYLYFPTLDQLLLDATVGAMPIDIDDALAAIDSDDPHLRVSVLIDALCESMDQTLPLGRRLIKLTVDAPSQPGTPKRGYRRVHWIEQAIEPIRRQLGKRAFEDLVSALALVIGWEPFIVLGDIRGLSEKEIRRVATVTAHQLVDTALAAAALRAKTRSSSKQGS